MRGELISLLVCKRSGLGAIRLDQQHRVDQVIADDLPVSDPVPVDDEVLRYAKDPSFEPVPTPLESVQSSEDLREGFGRDILCVLPAAQPSECISIQAWVQMVEQGRGGILVAASRSTRLSLEIFDIHSLP